MLVPHSQVVVLSLQPALHDGQTVCLHSFHIEELGFHTFSLCSTILSSFVKNPGTLEKKTHSILREEVLNAPLI